MLLYPFDRLVQRVWRLVDRARPILAEILVFALLGAFACSY
jgi:hypothetical protein